MKNISIYTDYVTLGQFLKIADIISSGGEAKIFLLEHEVLINDTVDNRRGRKLRNGDKVKVLNEEYLIVNESK
jgi:S4 domain protein YaaA